MEEKQTEKAAENPETESEEVRKAVAHVRRVGMIFIILLIAMMAAFLIVAFVAFHSN